MGLSVFEFINVYRRDAVTTEYNPKESKQKKRIIVLAIESFVQHTAGTILVCLTF